MKTYTVGARVFCDLYFSGKPHGKVIEIVEPGDGKRRTVGTVRVRLTETAGAYRKGEVLEVATWQAVPVRHVFRKPGSVFRHVDTDYCYVQPGTKGSTTYQSRSET